jgi:hypothetical protein
MQTTVSVPADQFPELLKRLPAGLDLDRLAHETKALQRKRRIGDGASLLRLALARGRPRHPVSTSPAFGGLPAADKWKALVRCRSLFCSAADERR